MKLMGHSSVTTTQMFYSQVEPHHHVQAAEAIQKLVEESVKEEPFPVVPVPFSQIPSICVRADSGRLPRNDGGSSGLMPMSGARKMVAVLLFFSLGGWGSPARFSNSISCSFPAGTKTFATTNG
jgi:hypothetical protein